MTYVDNIKESVSLLLDGGHAHLAQELLNMLGKGQGLHRGGGVVRSGRTSYVYGHTEGVHSVTAAGCDCSQYKSMEQCEVQGIPVLVTCGHIAAHRIDSGSLTDKQVSDAMGWAEEQAGLTNPGSKMLAKSTEFHGYVLEAIAKKAKAQAAAHVNIIRFQAVKARPIGGKPYHDMLLDVEREKLPAVWAAAYAKWGCKGMTETTLPLGEAEGLIPVSKGLTL